MRPDAFGHVVESDAQAPKEAACDRFVEAIVITSYSIHYTKLYDYARAKAMASSESLESALFGSDGSWSLANTVTVSYNFV